MLVSEFFNSFCNFFEDILVSYWISCAYTCKLSYSCLRLFLYEIEVKKEEPNENTKISLGKNNELASFRYNLAN